MRLIYDESINDSMANELITQNQIINKIYTIRGLQVMIDSDLAEFYQVETRRLNEQVKRNIARFPPRFMIQLNKSEYENLISQNAISSLSWGGIRKLPYAFTEQGIAMLSTVLKSKTAIEVSIQIMDVFVEMRRFILKNAQLFQRLDNVEKKQIEHKIECDDKFNKIFSAIENKQIKLEKGIFFEGQIFDAYKFVSEVIRSAKSSIVVIDNYIDESVLTLFNKVRKDVSVIIYTMIYQKN